MTIDRCKLHSQHVYVVDDDPSVRAALVRGLGHLGFDVHQFAGPGQFLETVALFRPAALVVDMQMPGMTGVELQALLRDRGWEVPVIFISGQSSVSQGITAMRQGAFDFLVKPFDLDHLIGLIDKALQLDAGRVRAELRRQECLRQLAVLKPRELETLHLLAKGYSYAELMQAMGIAMPTAKQYRAAVMRKLQFETLAQLIAFCEQIAVPEP